MIRRPPRSTLFPSTPLSRSSRKPEKVTSAGTGEMLRRPPAAPSPAPAAGSGRGGPAGMAMPAAMRGAGRVMLVAGGVEHELKPLAGDMSTVYAYIKMLIYYD